MAAQPMKRGLINQWKEDRGLNKQGITASRVSCRLCVWFIWNTKALGLEWWMLSPRHAYFYTPPPSLKKK
jgi:hypothetical protein